MKIEEPEEAQDGEALIETDELKVADDAKKATTDPVSRNLSKDQNRSTGMPLDDINSMIQQESILPSNVKHEPYESDASEDLEKPKP